MKLKKLLRQLILDHFGQREDRYYWRQPTGEFALPINATLCLWQPDGKLGDSVLHTILVRNIAQQRPDVRIVILCSPSLVHFWTRIPGVWKAISCQKTREAAKTLRTACHQVDVLISLETFVSVDTLSFMRRVAAPITVGISVGRFKAFTYSIADNTYDYPRRHVTERLRNLCSLMKLDYNPSSSIAEIASTERPALLESIDKRPIVYLNTYGAGPNRTFSEETISWLISEILRLAPNVQVLLSVPDAQRSSIEKRLGLNEASNMSLVPRDMSIWQLIGLIQQCFMVITPDTAIGHIAAALNKPSTVFFADSHYSPVVWLPLGTHLQTVLPQTGSHHVDHFSKELATDALRSMLDAGSWSAQN